MSDPATTEPVSVDGQAVELVHVDARPVALFGSDPVEVVEQATRVANALKDVLVRKRLFSTIRNKPYVSVSGWQLAGAMLGVTAVCTATEPIDGGFKATVEARTADGRVIGRADALCSKHEKQGPWRKAEDFALLSMAQTRATSKALKGPLGFVIALAGYESTPAEEMTFVEQDVERDVEQPAPVVATISEERAASLAHDALLTVDAGTLRLAASHAAGGRDVGDCDDGRAAVALGSLTESEAGKLERWVARKADSAVSEEVPA